MRSHSESIAGPGSVSTLEAVRRRAGYPPFRLRAFPISRSSGEQRRSPHELEARLPVVDFRYFSPSVIDPPRATTLNELDRLRSIRQWYWPRGDFRGLRARQHGLSRRVRFGVVERSAATKSWQTGWLRVGPTPGRARRWSTARRRHPQGFAWKTLADPGRKRRARTAISCMSAKAPWRMGSGRSRLSRRWPVEAGSWRSSVAQLASCWSPSTHSRSIGSRRAWAKSFLRDELDP